MTRMSRKSKVQTGIVTAVAAATFAGGIATLPAATAAPLAPAAVVAPVHRAVLPACSNPLGHTLRDAGFRGRNLREAWAIAMRESSGRADLGPGSPDFNGHDWGLFQWNKPSFGGQSWWRDSKMLNAVYNAKLAFRFSRGGRDWHLWGLTGSGRTSAGLYSSYGWSSSQIYSWITEPFQRYYRQFPASARGCA